MNLDKIREEITDLLYKWELFGKMELEECEEIKMPISFLGVYVLNRGEDPTVGFFEVDVEELTNRITERVKEIYNK